MSATDLAIPAIRPAAPGDGPALAHFFAAAFTDTFGHLYPPADLAQFLDDKGAATFAAEIADPGYHFRLAEMAGGIGAFVKLGPPTLPFEPVAGRRAIELCQLYVAPGLKGSGIAHELMRWALDHAGRLGFEDIYLSVFTENHRARRFYAAHGFEEVGPYGFQVGSVIDEDIVCRRAL
jgi:ribosomal protein S18 acetylase RimI-like enzyme